MLNYRAVGTRCAVDMGELAQALDLPEERVACLLAQIGFDMCRADPVHWAKQLVGQANYHRDAPFELAPQVVDCSSLTKWVYHQCGIWLPRQAVQQRRRTAAHPVKLRNLRAGDLVFRTGYGNSWYPDEDISQGVGHVGLATGQDTVIHAIKWDGIKETSLKSFLGKWPRHGATRVLPAERCILTLVCNMVHGIEYSEDVFFLLQANLYEQHSRGRKNKRRAKS
jgi:hypothetical protein